MTDEERAALYEVRDGLRWLRGEFKRLPEPTPGTLGYNIQATNHAASVFLPEQIEEVRKLVAEIHDGAA